MRRWLADDVLKPWQHRSWIFPRDPDFAVKAARVLDLYAGTWQGEPMGEGEFVVCADEKTSIQARCRCHPTLPPGKARMMRVEHEDALAARILAFQDRYNATATPFDWCFTRADLNRLLQRIAAHEPVPEQAPAAA